jgi:hypothetical protein
MHKILCIPVFVFAVTIGAFPQEQGYQRNDIHREAGELTLEGALNYWTETSGGLDVYNMNLTGGAEYRFFTNHSVQGSLPYRFIQINSDDIRHNQYYAGGDLRLQYNYFFKPGHLSANIGPLVTIPLAASDEYAAREGVISGGDSRWHAGLSASLTGVLDPVVWTLGLVYDVGLPKQERFYTSWQPVNLQLSASFSDLFNDRFGYSVGLRQSINLQVNGGRSKPENGSVSTAGRFEFLILFDKEYIRLTLDAYAYPQGRPYMLGIVYGHRFTA